MKFIKKNNFSIWVVICLLVISFVSIYSFLLKGGSALPGLGDDLIVVWAINQTIQKIPTSFSNLFDGNIFYPEKYTLLYSDLMVPSALISYIPVKLTQNPLIGYSFNLLVGQFFSLLAVFVWAKEFSKDKLSSLIATLVFAFSQIRYHFIGHLHVWNMHYWAFSSFFFYKYLKNKNHKYLYLSVVLAAVQMWENQLKVYFIFIISLVFLINDFLKRLKNETNFGNFSFQKLISKYFLKITYYSKEFIIDLKKPFVLFIILISPVIYYYLLFLISYKYVRPIREVAHFSLSIDDFWGEYFNPGLFSVIFISVIVGYKKIKESKKLRVVVGILLFSFLLSFGPVLKYGGETVKFFGKIFIPLPYIVLYYLIPGFQSLRTPPRWLLVTALFSSVLISYLLSKTKGLKRNLLITSFILLAILGGRIGGTPTPFPKVNNYPEVYTFLKESSYDVILEYPMYTWANGPEKYTLEMFRMVYSLYHKKELVNGASGFFPQSWQINILREVVNEFPDNRLDQRLGEIGVDVVVLKKDELEANKLEEVKQIKINNIVYESNDYLVYEIP